MVTNNHLAHNSARWHFGLSSAGWSPKSLIDSLRHLPFTRVLPARVGSWLLDGVPHDLILQQVSSDVKVEIRIQERKERLKAS